MRSSSDRRRPRRGSRTPIAADYRNTEDRRRDRRRDNARSESAARPPATAPDRRRENNDSSRVAVQRPQFAVEWFVALTSCERRLTMAARSPAPPRYRSSTTHIRFHEKGNGPTHRFAPGWAQRQAESYRTLCGWI